MYSAPHPAPDPASLLMRDSSRLSVDSSKRSLLNPLIRIWFSGICLVTNWFPKRCLNDSYVSSIR